MNRYACSLADRISPTCPWRMYSVFASLAIVTGATSVARADDSWFGRDKTAHFGASALISATGYGVGVAAFGTRVDGLAIGGSSALAVGLGKEMYDAAGYGTVSARDFTWNAIGAATGLFLALTIDWLVRGNVPCFGASCLSSKTLPPIRGAGFTVQGSGRSVRRAGLRQRGQGRLCNQAVQHTLRMGVDLVR